MSDIVKIEFNGVAIRSVAGEHDMLNLTDMWKACGSDPNKRPNDWIRKEGAPFIEFVRENVKGAQGPLDLIRTIRGGTNPGTIAHWKEAVEAIRNYCDFTNGLGAQLSLPKNTCKCGKILAGGELFCPKCGNHLALHN